MTEQHHTTPIRGAIGIVLMAVLAACGPTEATPATTTAPPSTTTPPTTTTTPPTTAAPATTATPTTAAATTALATSTPSTATPVAESPETEVGNRVIQIFDRYYECLSAPPECDPNQIAQDYTPNSPTIARRRDRIAQFTADGTRLDRLDLRSVSLLDATIGEEGTSALVRLCERDGVWQVNAKTGEVINDEVGLYEWTVILDRAEGTDIWLVEDALSDRFAEGSGGACGW